MNLNNLPWSCNVVQFFMNLRSLLSKSLPVKLIIFTFLVSWSLAFIPHSSWAAQGPLSPDETAEGQAEWIQSYDPNLEPSVDHSTVPLLSAQTVASTEQALQNYRTLATQGGWPLLPALPQPLQLGAKGPLVVLLKKRLVISEDLPADKSDSPIFDSYLETAVRHFQLRHGLGATGIVTPATLEALNVPVEQRIHQLELNLVRLRSFASGNLGGRFVTLNIPAARVETVENGTVVTRHVAGVGKIDRQSPVMQTRALDINFNPFWTAPASIIKKDLIPRMQANPNYLTENKIRIYNKEGVEISPRTVNWNSSEATQYKFRQDPGGDVNSLGSVRINIANPYGVYMHDTPVKGIFGEDFRFVSSGCVRIQNVRTFVAWLLKDNPGWTRDHVDDVIHSGDRVDVKITSPVNVYWIYLTAWATEGVVQFRDDIYKRDGFTSPSPTAGEEKKEPGIAPVIMPPNSVPPTGSNIPFPSFDDETEETE